MIERLIGETGSGLDATGRALYARLAAKPRHVGAALDMMARWDVRPLEQDLPKLTTRLLLVSGEKDQMIPPEHARQVQKLLPAADLHTLAGLGHLAHEEHPADVATLLADWAGRP